MAALTMQKDFIIEAKKETILNLEALSKVHTMPQELGRAVLKDNALEKPTQALFNQLSHYLVRIIDPKAAESLSWPLYDSKTERAYRNDLSNFINQYSSRGLLAPVMTSYLVNPSCFKVTWLIFQMSQLALQKVLESKMKKDGQKKRYIDITAKYKAQEKDFTEEIEMETEVILKKFSDYKMKRNTMEAVGEKFRTRIITMENKLTSLNCEKFLENIVDTFLNKHSIEDKQKDDFLKIKSVLYPSSFFDRWLAYVDREMNEMESRWNEKVSPFLDICRETASHTDCLIARHTGEADQDSYMIQYNHETDQICTTELQAQVNSTQKYVLKNLVKDEKLIFPNLIRAFLVAISYIMHREKVGDEIYQFNEYLQNGEKSVREVVLTMQDVMKQVMNAESRLQSSPLIGCPSTQKCPEIPPLPDLTNICYTRDYHQTMFDGFTPLSMSKRQFNLQRRTTLHTFVKPQLRILVPSFSLEPREDFLKSIQSCRAGYGQLNCTQNFHNISIIPQTNHANETIAGFTSSCTKQQLIRLLSTKKSSSSKKFKTAFERPMNIKKCALFNESVSPNESSGLFRSYSSPNLYETREKRSTHRTRKLSVMQESQSPLLEVSGIATLDKDSSCERSSAISENYERVMPSLPTIPVTPVPDKKFHTMLKEFNIDLSKEVLTQDLTEEPPKRLSTDLPKRLSSDLPNRLSSASRVSREFDSNNVTPQNNSKLIQKTSSLEKIINRYKKVRASALNEDRAQCNDICMIVEEKENLCGASKILLPDLLSPNYSGTVKTTLKPDDKVRNGRKPRESLGTMLDVDDTFLDQFDLID